ncbi:MAG: amidase [Alphaproteobacteria bacterium]|nr:amidase [Alphaproteobacteria bacterium]
MTSPADLSAREAARAVAAGTLKAEALVEAYLERVEAIEPRLRSFVYLDPELARAQARAVEKAKKKGALAGVPVGVKDIIDTKDMPTECNSAILVGRRPTEDADCIAAVRAASGVILGKCVTTEFAGSFPGSTVNPYNPAHTPGGSSSGSAAAVAAGLVPFAFGTQTGGSVIRPASYCGCVGYKATRESLSLKGVHPLASSLDTLGFYARSADDALLFHAVLAGVKDTQPKLPRKPRLAVVRTAMRAKIEQPSMDLLEAVTHRLAAHAEKIDQIELPPPLDSGFDAQNVLISAGIAQAFDALEKQHHDLFSVVLLQAIESGRGHSAARVAEAEETRVACIAAIGRFFEGYDAILTPAAAGEAPKGLQWTGNPDFNRLWTFLGTPAVSIPVGLGPNGLPVGLQLVGARGNDRFLLALSEWAYTILGGITPPKLPAAKPMAALERRAGLVLDDALSQAWAEGDQVLQEMAAKMPRDLDYAVEPSHIFSPSRRSKR